MVADVLRLFISAPIGVKDQFNSDLINVSHSTSLQCWGLVLIGFHVRECSTFKYPRRLAGNHEGVSNVTTFIEPEFNNNLPDIFVSSCFRWVSQWTVTDQVTRHLHRTGISRHNTDVSS